MNINPLDILKNAQKIQEQMGAFQEKLATVSVVGSAGAGMVEVELNGRMDMISLKIAPELMDPAESEMLKDLIIAAYTNASEKIKEAINREMGAFAGGMNIPGGFPGLS